MGDAAKLFGGMMGGGGGGGGMPNPLDPMGLASGLMGGGSGGSGGGDASGGMGAIGSAMGLLGQQNKDDQKGSQIGAVKTPFSGRGNNPFL